MFSQNALTRLGTRRARHGGALRICAGEEPGQVPSAPGVSSTLVPYRLQASSTRTPLKHLSVPVFPKPNYQQTPMLMKHVLVSFMSVLPTHLGGCWCCRNNTGSEFSFWLLSFLCDFGQIIVSLISASFIM